MNFENVTLLGYNQNNRIWENGTKFGIEVDVTIQGVLLDDNAQDSIEGTWTKSQLLLAESEDWTEIVINGYELGRGKITNISFPEGDDLQRKEYTVSLFVLKEGNLDDVTTGIFSNLDYLETTTAPIHLFEDIDANISISNIDEIVSYTRSINFRIHEADDLAIEPHERAKFFAQKFFEETFDVGFLDGETDGVLTKAGKRFSRESYNDITGEVSFEQNFEFKKGDGEATNIITHTFAQDENGTITVTETGEILAIEETEDEYIEEDPSLYRTALVELENAVEGAFSRCNAVFNDYIGEDGYEDYHPLNQQRVSLQKAVDSFAGTADYSIVFTNNPSHQNEGYSHTFTIQIDRGADNITSVIENGEFEGLSDTLEARNNNVDAAFETEKDLIKPRLVSKSNIADEDLFLESRTISTNRFRGNLTYSYQYTDDRSRVNDENIKIVENDVTDDKPVHLFNQFGIVNVKEIIQSAGNSTEGTRNLSCKVVGYRDTSLTQLEQRAITESNSFIPSGNDVFLENCSFNYDKQGRELNLQVTWRFFEAIPEGKELLT